MKEFGNRIPQHIGKVKDKTQHMVVFPLTFGGKKLRGSTNKNDQTDTFAYYWI